MHVRSRLLLDVLLAVAMLVAFNPAWTGIAVHQWLSIAVIVPIVVHVVVNWEWALRVVARFFRKLLSVSRLNLVVDSALMVATVTVMLSGFMVSPALFAPVGIRLSVSTAWVAVHSWSADATIVLLAIHGVLHWKWALGVVRRLVAERGAASAARPAVVSATGAAIVRAERRIASSSRRQNGRDRAKRAAAERAVVFRTASAVSLSALMAVVVFVSVGLAQPSGAAARGSAKVAARSAGKCPVTGCTATTCHAATGARAAAFYGEARVAAWMAKSGRAKAAPPSVARRTSSAAGSSAGTVAFAASAADARQTAARKSALRKAKLRKAALRKAALARRSAAQRAAAKKAAAKQAAAKKAAAAKAASKPRKTVSQTCPVTGCSASTCHGAHGVSARVWYATH